MNDLDELFGGKRLRGVAVRSRIDHVLADVVFYDFRDETVQGAAARGGLLEDGGAFVIRIHGALDGLNLPAHAFETVEKFAFLFGDMTHIL